MFDQTPPNVVNFSQMYLDTIWCGRLVITEFDVSMAINFWQTSFGENEMKMINLSYSNDYVFSSI